MTYKQIYDQAIKNGCSPVLADMLASRCPPAGKTNDTYRNGTGLEKQFDNCPEIGDAIVAGIREKNPNFNPKGKMLVGSLIRPEVGVFDEQAWVSASDPLGDVKKRCQEQGRTVSGDVNYQAPEKDLGDGKYKVNDKIVERVARRIRKPGQRIEAAREIARDHITPKNMVGEGKLV